MSESIGLDTIREWAQEQEQDLGELQYKIDAQEYSITITRDHNLLWSYGVGVKSEYLSKFYSSWMFKSRSEMAKNLLTALNDLDLEIKASKDFHALFTGEQSP